MSEIQYTVETHMPIFNSEKRLVFEHGKLVLHAKKTNTIVYAPLTQKLIETYSLSKYLQVVTNQPATQSKDSSTKKAVVVTPIAVTSIKRNGATTSSSATVPRRVIIVPSGLKNAGRSVALVASSSSAPRNGSAGTSTPGPKPTGTSTPGPKPAGTSTSGAKPAGTNTSGSKPAGTGTSTPGAKPGPGSGSSSNSGTSKKRATWTTDATLCLIDCYKRIDDSTKIRNESIWKKISDTMKSKNYAFTITQCKDRFFYLKGEYTKKLESINGTTSDNEEIIFDYFDEFHDIFRDKPNGVPDYAVASRRSCVLSLVSIDEQQPKDDNTTVTQKYKKRRTTPADQLLKKNNENRERRDRRHRERIEVQKEAINELRKASELLKTALERRSLQL